MNSHLQVHSPEDSFIELMALGRAKMWNSQNHLQAASLEGLVAELIQVPHTIFLFRKCWMFQHMPCFFTNYCKLYEQLCYTTARSGKTFEETRVPVEKPSCFYHISF